MYRNEELCIHRTIQKLLLVDATFSQALCLIAELNFLHFLRDFNSKISFWINALINHHCFHSR